VSGPFQANFNCTNPLPSAGGLVTLEVDFTASSAGPVSGTLGFNVNAATLNGVVAGDTITIGATGFNGGAGIPFACVSSGATGNQFNHGANDTATAANLAAAINAYTTGGFNAVFVATSSGDQVNVTVGPGNGALVWSASDADFSFAAPVSIPLSASGVPLPTPDIAPVTQPYLLLHGSADGDVNGALWGSRPPLHYDHATSTKTFVRLIGGNHNFFSTAWVISDASQEPRGWPYTEFSAAFPAIPFTVSPMNPPISPSAQLMTATQEQEVAMGYVTTFVESVARSSPSGAYLSTSPALVKPMEITDPNVSLFAEWYDARTPLFADSFSGSPDTHLTSTFTSESTALLYDNDWLFGPVDPNESDFTNRMFRNVYGAVLTPWTSGATNSVTVSFGSAGTPTTMDLRGASRLIISVGQQPLIPALATNAAGNEVSPINTTVTPKARVGTPTGPVSFQAQLVTGGAGAPQTIDPTVVQGESIQGVFQNTDFDDGVVRDIMGLQTFEVPIQGFAVDGKTDLSAVTGIQLIFPTSQGAQAAVVTNLEVQ
jgi:hypothetical protein